MRITEDQEILEATEKEQLENITKRIFPEGRKASYLVGDGTTTLSFHKCTKVEFQYARLGATTSLVRICIDGKFIIQVFGDTQTGSMPEVIQVDSYIV